MAEAALITAIAAWASPTATVGVALFEFGVSYVLGQVVQGLFKKKTKTQSLPGTQLSAINPSAAVETAYGEVVKSGTIFFMASSGPQDEFLHVCYALAGHECDAILEAYMDGVPESELLHTNTLQEFRITWSGHTEGNAEHGIEYPIDVDLTVQVNDISFTSSEGAALAAEINASDLPVTAVGSGAVGDMRATLTITAESGDSERFTVKAGRGSFHTRVYNSENDADNDAFYIWRHTGAPDQAADPELLKRFSDGRTARVVVKWPADKNNLLLTINGQQVVGPAEDIIAFIDANTVLNGITAEQQGGTLGSVEILIEHTVPGQPIEVSSVDTGFSFEHLQSPAPVWTAAHRGRGVAYAHVRFARRSDIWGNRMPDVTFRVRGKKLFDPRDGTTKYSDNWALVMRDCLMQRYQIPAERMVDSEIAIAATVADERVILDDNGNTQARYTINGVVSDEETPDDLVIALQQHGGLMARRLGRPTLIPHTPQPQQAAITEDDLLAVPELQLNHPRRDLFNTVYPSFVGESTGWKESRAPEVTSAFYRQQDSDETLTQDSVYRFANDELRAQRLAKIDLDQHRQQLSISLWVKRHRIDCAAATVVPLDLPSLGFDGKLFQVMNASAHGANSDALANTGVATTGGIKLDLREYAPEVFLWNKGQAATRDYARNTTLSPTRFVRMPSQLDITTSPAWFVNHTNNMQLAMAYIDWAEPAQTNVAKYEVQWKQGADDVWRAASDVTHTQTVIGPISDVADLYARVRAVGLHGKRSRWAEAGPTPVNSVQAITGGDGAVNITKSVTAPEDPDINDIWLRQGVNGGPIVAKYYWDNAQWADISGSAIATAIATAFEAKDLADGSAKLFAFPSTQNPPPTATGEGDLWLQPDTKRIMRWDGSAYVVATSLDWSDIFGSTKPDDLASADGTYMIDATFRRLRAGYDTWTLNNDAQLITGGADDSVMRLRHSDYNSPVPSIVSKAPVVVPPNRYMTCTARVRARTGFRIKLIAVDDSGQPRTVTQITGLSVAYSENNDWQTVSTDLAIDINDHNRFLFELSGSVSGYYTNGEWEIDSVEFAPQRRVPHDRYGAAAWLNTLRAAGTLQPAGWPNPAASQFFTANQEYAMLATRPAPNAKVAGSTATFRVRYDVSQHAPGGLTESIHPTVTARIEGKKSDGTWAVAGPDGAVMIESTPPIWTPTTFEKSFDVKLDPEIVDPCEFRIVFKSDVIALVRVNEFTVAFWT